jgi:hypothetical protein
LHQLRPAEEGQCIGAGGVQAVAATGEDYSETPQEPPVKHGALRNGRYVKWRLNSTVGLFRYTMRLGALAFDMNSNTIVAISPSDHTPHRCTTSMEKFSKRKAINQNLPEQSEMNTDQRDHAMLPIIESCRWLRRQIQQDPFLTTVLSWCQAGW